MNILSNSPEYSHCTFEVIGVRKEGDKVYIDEYPVSQVYYHHDGQYYYISDDIRLLREIAGTGFSVNGLIQQAIFQANLYPYSLYQGIVSAPLNSVLHLEKDRVRAERLPFPERPHMNIQEICKALTRVFEDDLSNAGDVPYHMYSGGVDSSITFHFLKDRDTVAGSSIYTRTDTSDVSRGISHFEGFRQNLIQLDPEKYLKTLSEYTYFNPYICPGTIDDLFHCRAACDMGCSSIVNGHGSDELMAAYLFEEINDMKDVDYYMGKYSMLKMRFLRHLFDIELIWDTVENTMAPFDLKSLKGKIMWVNEFHQVPLQLSLMSNNARLTGDIKRYMPFSSREFFEIVLAMPEDLIANNGIAEYCLRYWARDFLPIRLWAKEKKTFEVDQDFILREQKELSEKIFSEKAEQAIAVFDIDDIQELFKLYDSLFAYEKINFLLYLGLINDFL